MNGVEGEEEIIESFLEEVNNTSEETFNQLNNQDSFTVIIDADKLSIDVLKELEKLGKIKSMKRQLVYTIERKK